VRTLVVILILIVLAVPAFAQQSGPRLLPQPVFVRDFSSGFSRVAKDEIMKVLLKAGVRAHWTDPNQALGIIEEEVNVQAVGGRSSNLSLPNFNTSGTTVTYEAVLTLRLMTRDGWGVSSETVRGTAKVQSGSVYISGKGWSYSTSFWEDNLSPSEMVTRALARYATKQLILPLISR
jgi:hypothetical protein